MSDERMGDERASDEPIESAETEPEHRFGIPDLVVALIIAFFFVAAIYTALGNLIGVPQALAQASIEAATPWVPLVAAVVVPPVIFVAALLVGRRRTVFERALILVVALAVNGALALSLTTLTLYLIPLS